jgi:hypothetical protein
MSVDKKLRVIPKPKPDTRTLLLPKPREVLPLIKCDADLNLICGGCGATLVEGVVENEIRNIVIRCPICEIYNEVE